MIFDKVSIDMRKAWQSWVKRHGKQYPHYTYLDMLTYVTTSTRAFLVDGEYVMYLSPHYMLTSPIVDVREVARTISHETLHCVLAIEEGWDVSKAMDSPYFVDYRSGFISSLLKILEWDGYIGDVS